MSEPGGVDAPEPAPQRGVSRAVAAGLGGEDVSARGVLAAIGGWRGVAESLLPPTVFLIAYVITRDATVSAILPIAISLISLVLRLVRREPLASAISGLLGVGVCAAAVLLTGEGQSYFVPGFFINAVWIIAYAVSLLVGWPLIGFVFGVVRGSFTEWRAVPVLRQAAVICSAAWMLLFAARLAVQLPLYFSAEAGNAGAVEALGVARLVMGVPLFALAVLFTWLVLARVNGAVPPVAESTASGEPDPDGAGSGQSSDE
ncbi:MAG: DUF3159 domain-containing protein [Leucobacter sp.]|nr:DUF3159 domain-containing protein [Leucobacter sp.]